MSLTLPKVKAGCGGIDMFLGGMSFLDPDYLVQKLETILQAAPAVAFQYLLETLDEKMGNIISKMEAATNYLNSIQVNDCRLANRMVQIARGDDNMSGIVEEMTGYKSVRQGFAKSWQQSREKIQTNRGNPTEDLKDALANCPREVTDIFRTGSLIAHAAARVGAGNWAGVMRARVGDVYMRWSETDKVPVFAAIPACPRQDGESADDFLTGRVQRRALNVPATANDCAPDGSARDALVLARDRMQAIATKIRTKVALTTEERQFVANVRTLPVYRMLELGVREGVTDSVIGDTDELVALTLAYQMLNNLTRTIDFALSNAERGADAAGAVDAASPNLCQTRILTKGLEQLRGLREEVGIAIGAVIASVRGQGMGLVAYGFQMLVGIGLFVGLIATTGTVHVYDRVRNAYQPVGNVPNLIVLVAGATNLMERALAEVIDDNTLDPNAKLEMGAGGHSFDLFLNAVSPTGPMTDSFLDTTVRDYTRRSYPVARVSPAYGIDDDTLLRTTADLPAAFAAMAGPATFSTVYTAADKGGRTVSCTEV